MAIDLFRDMGTPLERQTQRDDELVAELTEARAEKAEHLERVRSWIAAGYASALVEESG